MSDPFTCSICGKEHEGLMKDWGYKLPDDVWKIPEPERGEQARFDSDLWTSIAKTALLSLDIPASSQIAFRRTQARLASVFSFSSATPKSVRYFISKIETTSG